MKPLRMLGSAALMALMAMAIAGASSAMAEPAILCTTDSDNECEPPSHVHEATSAGAKATL